jgi:serine/threonine protein kinase HipA of HipAB toxin-antitoxin module
VGASADELGAFAEMIRTNDLNGLMQRVSGLAHRQPALFAGASVAAGFALARMVRFAMEQPSGYRASRPAYRTSQPSYATGAGAAPQRATQYQPQVQSAPVLSPTPGRDPRTTPPAATYPGTTYNG